MQENKLWYREPAKQQTVCHMHGSWNMQENLRSWQSISRITCWVTIQSLIYR